MNYILLKQQLTLNDWCSNAFCFLPQQKEVKALSLLTHGYTSDKTSILNWAVRLAEENVASLLFDLPGHYQGSFNEVESFEDFKNHSPSLFIEAYHLLDKVLKENHYQFNRQTQIVIAGHSLGGFLALKSLEIPDNPITQHPCTTICVGLGMAPKDKVHLFDTPFYKSTLKLRSFLVSPAIAPEFIFPWIKEEKKNFAATHKKIHLITGEDDMVVGKSGTEELAELLSNLNNDVTFERPRKLPHHQPDMAAAHIKKYLKDQNII